MFIKKIKKLRPDVPVVWGGFHPTIFPDETISNPNIDIVAYGEGASMILPLTEALQNNKPLDNVQGIMFKQYGETIRTEKPPFDRID